MRSTGLRRRRCRSVQLAHDFFEPSNEASVEATHIGPIVGFGNGNDEVDSSARAAIARSAPFRLAIRATYFTSGLRLMPAIPSRHRAGSATALGETKEVTSIFAKPRCRQRIDQFDFLLRRHECGSICRQWTATTSWM